MKKQLLLMLALLATMGMGHAMAPQSSKAINFDKTTKFNPPADFFQGLKIGDSFTITNVPAAKEAKGNMPDPRFLTDSSGKAYAENTYSIYPGGLKGPGAGSVTYTIKSIPNFAPRGAVLPAVAAFRAGQQPLAPVSPVAPARPGLTGPAATPALPGAPTRPGLTGPATPARITSTSSSEQWTKMVPGGSTPAKITELPKLQVVDVPPTPPARSQQTAPPVPPRSTAQPTITATIRPVVPAIPSSTEAPTYKVTEISATYSPEQRAARTGVASQQAGQQVTSTVEGIGVRTGAGGLRMSPVEIRYAGQAIVPAPYVPTREAREQNVKDIEAQRAFTRQPQAPAVSKADLDNQAKELELAVDRAKRSTEELLRSTRAASAPVRTPEVAPVAPAVAAPAAAPAQPARPSYYQGLGEEPTEVLPLSRTQRRAPGSIIINSEEEKQALNKQLYDAIIAGNIPRIISTLEAGADANSVKAPDNTEYNTLALAFDKAPRGFKQLALDALVTYGAKTTNLNDFLVKAVNAGDEKTVEWLLQNGATRDLQRAKAEAATFIRLDPNNKIFNQINKLLEAAQ